MVGGAAEKPERDLVSLKTSAFGLKKVRVWASSCQWKREALVRPGAWVGSAICSLQLACCSVTKRVQHSKGKATGHWTYRDLPPSERMA